MEFTLPHLKRQTRKILYKAESIHDSRLQPSETQKRWSYITLSLAAFCLFLIIFGSQNGFGFISPVSSFLNPVTLLTQNERSYKTFAYIPGWSETKYDDVVMDDTDILAFYDVPVLSDGTLDTDTNGYERLYSEDAQALFQRAHTNDTKVVLTLTLYSSSKIENLLDDTEAQHTLISNAIDEVRNVGIDGVVIDFDYQGTKGEYKQKFTDFITLFNKEFKTQLPGAQVDVAMTGKAPKQPLYDLSKLEQVSDNFLVSMDKVALLEEQQDKVSVPVYSYNDKAYWEDVKNALKDVSHYFAQENIAVEKAWYGNGDEYPLYKPEATKALAQAPQTNTLSTPLSQDVIDDLTSQVPSSARAAVRKNLPVIAKALEDEGILTANVLAYALATIEHETAGTFEPIDEIAGRKSARRLGYEGGNNYYGRGFIQLTHLRNYKAMGERIGMGDALARHPELASTPDVAAKVLAAFFVDNGPAKLARQGDFVAARRPVNPDANAYPVADLAMKFKYIL